MVGFLLNGERQRDHRLRQWSVSPRVSPGERRRDGRGTFSEVGDISELFGSYASMDVHAGAVESSAAQVVTKGTVSLAFAGTGKGVDLGVTFGKFVIERR